MRSDWCCWSVNTLSWWLVSSFGSCMVLQYIWQLWFLSYCIFFHWLSPYVSLDLPPLWISAFSSQIHKFTPSMQGKTKLDRAPFFCCCFLSDIFSICAVSIKRLFQGWSMETDYLLDISLWGVLVLEGETKCDTPLSGLCAALQKLN